MKKEFDYKKLQLARRLKPKIKVNPYPRFHLKIYFNHKLVNSLVTRKLKRILFRIRRLETNIKWDKVFLKFLYTKKETNSGVYTNMKELMNAYRCFEEILEEYKK